MEKLKLNKISIRPEVSSIYDKVPFGPYRGVPLTFLYHFDIGYLKWLIENKDQICIREWDYIKELTTYQKKMFIPEKSLTKQNYFRIAEQFTSEEILQFLGGQPLVRNDYMVNDENNRKLKLFDISPIPPKLFDRTYISYHWSSFPKISGIWELEGFESTSKEWLIVNLKKTKDSVSTIPLVEDKLGIIANLGPAAKFKHKIVSDEYNLELFKEGELIKIETVVGADEKYHISKIED